MVPTVAAGLEVTLILTMSNPLLSTVSGDTPMLVWLVYLESELDSLLKKRSAVNLGGSLWMK